MIAQAHPWLSLILQLMNHQWLKHGLYEQTVWPACLMYVLCDPSQNEFADPWSGEDLRLWCRHNCFPLTMSNFSPFKQDKMSATCYYLEVDRRINKDLCHTGRKKWNLWGQVAKRCWAESEGLVQQSTRCGEWVKNGQKYQSSQWAELEVRGKYDIAKYPILC